MHHMAAFLLLLLPGAYVALDTETLAVLSPLRALRVSQFGSVITKHVCASRQAGTCRHCQVGSMYCPTHRCTHTGGAWSNAGLLHAQVVCAGVWHNAVLCAACWLLAFCLPWLLLPLYSSGRGAVVRCEGIESVHAHCQTAAGQPPCFLTPPLVGIPNAKRSANSVQQYLRSFQSASNLPLQGSAGGQPACGACASG